jgi:hypothetical protein
MKNNLRHSHSHSRPTPHASRGLRGAWCVVRQVWEEAR